MSRRSTMAALFAASAALGWRLLQRRPEAG